MKKLLLTIGAITATAAPIAAVISCGKNKPVGGDSKEETNSKTSNAVKAISLEEDLKKFPKSGNVSTKNEADFKAAIESKKVGDEVTADELGYTTPTLSPGVTVKYTIDKPLNKDGYVHIAIELFMGDKKVTYNRKSMTFKWFKAKPKIDDVILAKITAAKDAIEKVADNWNSVKDETGDLYFVKGVPYFSSDQNKDFKTDADLKAILVALGFDYYLLPNYTSADKGKDYDKYKDGKIVNIFQIGYLSRTDNKYHIGDHKKPDPTAYDTKEAAVDAFLASATIEHSDLVSAVQRNADSIKAALVRYQSSKNITDIIDKIKDAKANEDIDQEIKTFIGDNDLAKTNAFVAKYIGDGKEAKVINVSTVNHGSKSFGYSYKLGSKFYLNYGLFAKIKAASWLPKSDLGTYIKSTAKAFVQVEFHNINPGSKQMVVAFIKLDSQWFLLTDVLRYLAHKAGDDTFTFMFDTQSFIGGPEAEVKVNGDSFQYKDLVDYINRTMGKATSN